VAVVVHGAHKMILVQTVLVVLVEVVLLGLELFTVQVVQADLVTLKALD
jgi:hypothetical protein